MGRTKTSGKPRNLSTKSKAPILIKHDPYSKELARTKFIQKAVLQALIDSDLDAVRDVLTAHLRTVNKSALAARTNLGRQTLFDLMDSKKEFNPSLKTLSIILDHLAALCSPKNF